MCCLFAGTAIGYDGIIYGLAAAVAAERYILTQKGGREVELGIRPRALIKRGGNLVYIEDLGVGNYITAKAIPLPGDRLQQITVPTSGA